MQATRSFGRLISIVFLFGGLASALSAQTFSINDTSVLEGDSGTANMVFTVTATGLTGPATVDWVTADGSATAPTDYTAASGTLNFTVAEPSQQIVVTVIGEEIDEQNHHFFVNLSNASVGTITDAQGIGTILSDDPVPVLSITDVTQNEGTGGNTPFDFVLTIDRQSDDTLTVNWATAAVSDDYIPASGTATFLPGELVQTVTIQVVADSLDENQENFNVNITGGTHVDIGDFQGQGTIIDDDPPATISIGDVTILEGTGGSTQASFPVTLNTASGRLVLVDFATANGSAASPGDFTAASGTVTFQPGDTSETILITIATDADDELDENFVVNLSNDLGGAILDGQGVGTITDDDGPTISISDVTVTEGNAGTVNAVFNVALSVTSGQTVTVNWATANATAVAPGDYTAASGTVTFVAGDTAETVTVAVNGDVLDEADETFLVSLTTPTNATIADGQGVGTITDDDAVPAISISDVTVVEGDAGTVNAVFDVALSAASGQTVTVNWATANATAAAPGDYTSASGTVTFVAGDTAETVTVQVAGDLLDEVDEAFLVNLTTPANATIADAQGVGTITDDDAVPAISISDVTVVEGNAGTVNAVFNVTLSAASGQTVTASWATANQTAVAPGDYASGSSTLTFVAGDTAETITVAVAGDLQDEIDETYLVNLTSPSNATIADGQGVGTITDDDAAPAISISDVTVVEGNAGTVNAVFNVTLSAASGQTVTASWATANQTAVAPGDYASGSSTVTFVPGDTAETVTVAVAGDLLDEIDETYLVNLTSPGNATIADGQGVGTITDDDGAPAISISDVTVVEGNAGTVNAVFNVTMSAASGQTVTVNWATANQTAVAPGDYATGSGTVTFVPGDAAETVTVAVAGDLLDEINETFLVNLTGPGNATIADAQGVGTITDDDGAPSISISDVVVVEGNAGTVNAVFNVTLSAASGQTVSVNWATANQTAVAPGDYASSSGTVTFVPGDTAETITVAVAGDLLDEINETFLVNLTSPSNATIADAQGSASITDDDATPAISIADVTVTEGNAGTVNAVFNVTLSATSGQTVTVNWATANQTAVAPGDYAAGSGTVTFVAGDTAETVTVAAAGDLLDEINETFLVNLTTPGNATISDNQGVGTITDDDATPSISLADVTVTEGNAGTVNAIFNVTLSAASGQTVTVNWATANQTAVSPADYAAGSGTVTFVTGDTAETITVAVAGDLLDELSESFLVNLTGPSAATLADGQGVGTITDDDAAPSIAIGDVTVVEGNAGTVNAVFNVTLSAASGQTVTVNWASADATAVAPGDYAAASGTVTFVPGDAAETVTVVVAADLLDEIDETYLVNLTTPSNATVGDGQGVGTITDDDATPSIVIGDVTVTEGNAGTVNAVFNVALSAASGQTVTVDWASADQTAVAPGDYAAASGTVTFVAGDTAETITIAVNGDAAFEPNETFLVDLTNAGNATIADAQGVGTIDNDDTAGDVHFSAATYSVNESAGTATITVARDGDTTVSVTVDYATTDGTASSADYTTATGTLTFDIGQSSKTFDVTILTDALDEADETVNLTLSNVTGGATLGTPSAAVLTITDDDESPTISIGDVTVTEGNSGTVSASFDVTLSAASGRTVTADWASADGSAVAPGDYASGSSTVTFVPGDTAETVTVLVNGDTLDESDENFFVNLSNLVDATAADVQGEGTIEDDENTLVAAGLSVDASAGPSSDGNGIFEPEETVVVSPAWENSGASSVDVTGDALSLSGPAGGLYTIEDATADYGSINAGATRDCAGSTDNCYEVTASAASRPALHWDVDLLESLSTGTVKSWSLHIGDSFPDIPRGSNFYRFVETILHQGVTAGCGPGGFCGDSPTTREQIAVFLLRANDGPTYTPPACTTPAFGDVPCGSPFAPWVNELSARGVTAGCGGGNFCPTDPVTREQMSVFLLRTLEGPSYTPPACTTPAFSDVPCSSPFAPWVNEIAGRGITAGCGGGAFCPADPVTRAQMAVFLVVTFALDLNTP